MPRIIRYQKAIIQNHRILLIKRKELEPLLGVKTSVSTQKYMPGCSFS